MAASRRNKHCDAGIYDSPNRWLQILGKAMRYGAEVYHNLKKVIKEKYGQDAVNVGDEAGFAPKYPGLKEGLNIKDAIAKAGYMESDDRNGMSHIRIYKEGKMTLTLRIQIMMAQCRNLR
jgi:hypothetical protein